MAQLIEVDHDPFSTAISGTDPALAPAVQQPQPQQPQQTTQEGYPYYQADQQPSYPEMAPTAPVTPAAPAPAPGRTGRGSWYSQFAGNNVWRDYQDRPGSNALGVPDEMQGIALPSRNTLGQWFDVTAPDGRVYRLQQTDVGPGQWTGRGIDVSAAAADRMGYSPKNFPTDAGFTSRPADPNSAPPDYDDSAFQAAAARTRRSVKPVGGQHEGLATRLAAQALPEWWRLQQKNQIERPAAVGGLAQALIGEAQKAVTLPQRMTENAPAALEGDPEQFSGALPAEFMRHALPGPFRAKLGELGAFGGRLAADVPKLMPGAVEGAAAAPAARLIPVPHDPYAWTGATPTPMHPRAPEDFHAAIAEAK